jgi:superfamily I DNA/RNA helicase
MDVSTLLDGLNDKQRDAVAAPRCNLLVLAGAGSGKTRVLVHRIAWLMQVERCSPFSIIAVTFTNKAAAEMRGRVEKVIGCRRISRSSTPTTSTASFAGCSRRSTSTRSTGPRAP